MTMDCKEAKQKIFEAIDGTLEDRTELDAHLEECVSCRSEYRELVEVQEGLTALAEPAVQSPEGDALANRVMDALGDDPPGDADPLADAPPNPDTSGLRDLRELAALSAGEEAGESLSDIFGLRGQDEAGPSVEVPAVVPPPVLMPVETRPGWVKPALVLGSILFLAVVALAAVIFVRHGRKSRLEKAGAGPAVASADQNAAGNEDTEHQTASRQPAGPRAGSGPNGMASAPSADQGNEGMAPEAGLETASMAPTTGAIKHRMAGLRRSGRASRRSRHPSTNSPAQRPTARAASRPSPEVPAFTTHARPASSGKPAGSSGDPLAARLSKKGGGEAARNAPQEHLPANLSPSQIRRVMGRASGAMKRCYERNKQAGILTVRVTVKGATGRISSLSVSGKFRGTPTARCALKAVRRLKFPRFSAPSQKFSYPYLLR